MVALSVVVMFGLSSSAPLTPEAAVELIERNPRLTAVAEELAEAEAWQRSAFRLENPELRARVRHGEALWNVVPPGEERAILDEVSAGLRWSPPELASFGFAQAEFFTEVQQERAELDLIRREMVAQVRLAHAQVMALEAEEALALSALDLSTKVSADVAKRLEADATTRLEVSMVDLDRIEAAGDLAEVRAELRVARAELQALVGLPRSSPLVLAPPREAWCRRPRGTIEDLVTRAVKRGPALEVARAEAAEADAASRTAAMELVPWFKFVEVELREEKIDEPWSVAAGVGMTLPLFDWNLAPFDAWAARKRRFVAEEQALANELELSVRRAAEEVLASVEVVDAMRTAQGAVVSASLEGVRASLEAEQSDVIELQLVHKRTVKARRSLMKLELACAEAAIELLRLVGDDAFEPS